MTESTVVEEADCYTQAAGLELEEPGIAVAVQVAVAVEAAAEQPQA